MVSKEAKKLDSFNKLMGDITVEYMRDFSWEEIIGKQTISLK